MPSSLGRDGEPQRHVFFREKHGLQLGNRGEDMSPAACPPQVEPGCVCVIALEFLPGSLRRQRGSGTCGGGVGAPGGGGAESRAQVRREGAQAHWRSAAPRPRQKHKRSPGPGLAGGLASTSGSLSLLTRK